MEASDRGKVILDQLLSANKSYVAGDSLPQSKLSPPSLRKDLADNGQQPCAAIIACADSRVAPEIVFGAGLGSVFVVRNAGNVVWEDSNAGSLEFAVSVLKVPLVIVLGHTMCGAVGAAVCACKSPSCPEEESPLAKHVARIARVVKNAVGGQEEIRDAVLMNVRNGVECLREGSTAVGDAFRNGAVSVVGAVYDIASGEVFVIDQ